DVSAGGKNPFEANRIHSRSVGSVCPLENNERGHRVHRQFEASVEKTWPVRSGQYPSIANSRVPHACILGPARNRVAAARPQLEFATTFLRAILGYGQRSCHEQNGQQKKRGGPPNGSCHRYVPGRDSTIRENERYVNPSRETNQAPNLYHREHRGTQGKSTAILQTQAAIHGQHLAGNELRSGSEEHHG